MTETPTRILTAAIRFTFIAGVTGCVTLAFPGAAAADSGTIDQFVGGSQCGGQPSACAGVSVPFTQPSEANAVEVSFTKNNNPCPDFNVKLNADGVTDIPLSTPVQLAPGNHTLNVAPTCSTDLTSWGGEVHISKIAQTGKPANPNAPAAQTTPANAIVVNIEQNPIKTIVNVQNVSQDNTDCSYDAEPKSPLLPPVHRDFHLNQAPGAGSTTSLDFPSPPVGATYHIAIVCKAEPFAKEDGHFDQDVTGSL